MIFKSPADKINDPSGVAQLAERVAVNHLVGGSNPSPGATKRLLSLVRRSRKKALISDNHSLDRLTLQLLILWFLYERGLLRDITEPIGQIRKGGNTAIKTITDVTNNLPLKTLRIVEADEDFPSECEDHLRRTVEVLRLWNEKGNPITDHLIGSFYETTLSPDVRKGRGCYYTPKEITHFMCRELLKDCRDPEKLRILDPAVGSGHFLVSCLEVLLDILKSSGKADPDCSLIRKILENNLYGVDIDATAVKVTRARLTLVLLDKCRPLQEFTDQLKEPKLNIKEGNALIGPIREDDDSFIPDSFRPFRWFKEFPEVFSEKGGFDAVVGNPPYGNILPKHYKKLIGKNNKNIAIDFIERSLELINEKGKISLIIPHTILRAKGYSKFRELLWRERLIWKVVDTSNPFPGVTLEMAVIFLTRKHNRYVTLQSLRENTSRTLPTEKVFSKGDKRILLYRDELYERVIGECPLYPFNGRRGHDITVKAEFLHKTKKKDCLWLLRGRNIDRFRLVSRNGYDRFIPKDFAIRDFSRGEIVLTQFGTNLKASRFKPEVHYPSGGTIVLKTELPAEIALMILNSRFINNFLIRYTFNGARLTVHLDGLYLREIPVPEIVVEEEKTLIDTVKEIEEIVKRGDLKEGLILNEALVLDLYLFRDFKILRDLRVNTAEAVIEKFKKTYGHLGWNLIPQ